MERITLQFYSIMQKLELLHIPNNSDVQVGDVLVTSGLGGVFPVGYPVAEVVEFTPVVSQPYAEVFARPMAQLDRSREVLLVWHKEFIEEMLSLTPDERNSIIDRMINSNSKDFRG